MRILAAHPPEYFPGLPFFLKMELADKFIVADDLQFSTRSQINRTKIRTAEGWTWLTVPALSKGRLLQKINKVKILHDDPWQRKHLRTIQANYKYVSFYDHYFYFIEEVLKKKWNSLFELNNELIINLKKQLKITTPLFYSSEIEQPKTGTEKVIQLIKHFDFDHYLIAENEQQFIDEKLLTEAGINLIIKKYQFPKYFQQFEPFEKNMSVLDLLFNTGNEAKNIIMSGLI